MSCVLVVDTTHRPLDPVHPGQARRLLSQGQAAVWRRSPFTLILPRAGPDAPPHPLRLKIDPGSRTSGLALVTETAPAAQAAEGTEGTEGTEGPEGTEGAEQSTASVVWAGELTHRGSAVHA